MPNQKVKIGVISLGCPKNTADTEALLSKLLGDCQLSNIKDAGVVLLNTCAFLKKARDEVYENLEELNDKKVILLGCLVSEVKNEILMKYPQIKAVVPNSDYPKISEIVKIISEGGKYIPSTTSLKTHPKNFIELSSKFRITPKSYAYIKIAEGCNNACSFCLIPKLKGSYKSRSMESIMEEAEALVSSGVKELIMVAQDTGYYGVDLYGKKSLHLLLEKLAKIKGDFWIRVLYIYPERITDELLSVIKSNPKILRYFDIPLQHGDDDILKKMRRPNRESAEKVISKIRMTFPEAVFRTSLIVGFPGETKQNFKNLLEFIAKIDFDNVGVFEYSKEKGTVAGNMEDQIEEQTKHSRRKEAMLLQQKISYQKNKNLIGKKEMAVVEKYDPKAKIFTGRLKKFAPEIDGQLTIHASGKKTEEGSIKEVIITKALPYDLEGKII